MLIEHVLPPHAVGEDAFGDPPATAPNGLFPIEEREIAQAGEKRRREFTTARQCAHRALTRLGLPPTPVPPGPTGAPAWPPGITGSITHCDGYRAAAVAHSADLPHLGIDAEPHAPLPATVRAGITTATERTHLQDLAATHPDIPWDRLLFSAKESVYKTCAPLAPRPLQFDDAEITFTPTTGTFIARLLLPWPTDVPAPVLPGRWHASHGILLTATTLPRPA
ncbi:4'-phosphopantetheinyl transferase family protein [Streptomyces noursei]|uniref:4'-phosphopantetheinyl transferase family protein n=1 Tax=Streptomyces noursei TaxID=1971 RepID=UPI00167A2F39|nr:4'-phosphopantetheinyl transferase superfamily protein [Streptomyces noursei]MCZ1017309.1 4'-phosphopantetheinyl transferase superfamily protein [Streptomyces noursei]GGX18159.1 4'-phosphopantetheinyl transferase [Streptomyces noursei]